ncbi:GAF domain-containing protein [Amycolatopsis bartoniae]|uniref:Transcriptional regulator n=2 Tax=Amycolatopsis bartoniae TaxID=941986 RepID=A0A8H9IWU9_9PSEU|nr:GAF and ANTAR domain-containing protein [Amycolatopsis bartoniae]MBB2936828.1 GAF domain-containing protein [Amycolatopsis bartoniae]TVT07279.1 GAF and ANTAR domain-containing protein [Amycolatopsis bartoniae]GHF50439.1 transcriptional regulator [Amycolatopsis bartoniae]
MTDQTTELLPQLDEVKQALEVLSEAVAETDELGPLLQAVCAQVVRVVPGADMASITILRGDGASTVASTDERAVKIDAAQYDEGDGPCLRAARNGETVCVDLPAAERMWPHFAAVTHGQGVGSYLAAPLDVAEGLTGAVNLFGFGDHGFRDLDQQYLELYTLIVTTVLRLFHRAGQAREQVRHLSTAMQSRGVIEQAKGILMAARRISEDEAFQLLVARSQRENVKLHTIAARFVAESTRA